MNAVCRPTRHPIVTRGGTRSKIKSYVDYENADSHLDDIENKDEELKRKNKSQNHHNSESEK